MYYRGKNLFQVVFVKTPCNISRTLEIFISPETLLEHFNLSQNFKMAKVVILTENSRDLTETIMKKKIKS